MQKKINDQGSIMLALVIVVCILAVLYLQGYIKETQKAQESKEQLKEDVTRYVEEEVNKNISELENETGYDIDYKVGE